MRNAIRDGVAEITVNVKVKSKSKRDFRHESKEPAYYRPPSPELDGGFGTCPLVISPRKCDSRSSIPTSELPIPLTNIPTYDAPLAAFECLRYL
ncbi:hypothetical protein N7451_010840 [Penicillium sp. IBT 35674x]|nr:hypothetical protein N7451_010840 [Penicillium sp. IBT 35674x]